MSVLNNFERMMQKTIENNGTITVHVDCPGYTDHATVRVDDMTCYSDGKTYNIWFDKREIYVDVSQMIQQPGEQCVEFVFQSGNTEIAICIDEEYWEE